MFGYIRAYSPELSKNDWTRYRANYCGLCREMGKRYGFLNRLTLNYDFVFYLLLQECEEDASCHFCRKRCIMHPIKKRESCDTNKAIVAAANIASIALYYKILDNIEDEAYPKRMLMKWILPYFKKNFEFAKAIYPDVAEVFEKETKNQKRVEENQISSVDEASEPTARMMESVLLTIEGNESDKRVLKRIGYLLGRYMYMCDALDDLEKDQKKHNYNPFLLQKESDEEIRNKAKQSLYLTTGEIGITSDLLNQSTNDTLIMNILHLGLKATVDYISIPHSQRRKYKHDRSL